MKKKKYIHYGHKKFEKSLFCKITNNNNSLLPITKPIGGLWASSTNTKYGWVEWCKKEGLGICKKDNSFIFSLKESAKILNIDSVADVEKIPKNEIGKFDFEKSAELYDAIEFNISKDSGLYYALYGWDCDSILILNPEIVLPE